MAYRQPDNCQETAPQPVGTTGPIILGGAASGFLPFDTPQVADGDLIEYTLLQGVHPTLTYESGIGIFATAPSRRILRTGAGTQVYRSSNGNAPVNWSGGGTVNVLGSTCGARVESLLDPSRANGFLVQTAANTFAARSIVGHALLPVLQGDGVAGNPMLDASAILSKLAGAAAADRTMGGRLILAAVASVITGFSGGIHKRYANDALTDQIDEIRTSGVNEWTHWIREAAGLRQVVTRDGSGLNDADRLQAYAASAFLRRGTPSGAQSIASGGTIGWNHGLGAKPSLVAARLTCLTGEFNYSAGDTVELGAGLANMTADTAGTGGSNHGHSIRTDASSVVVRFGSNGSVYRVPGAITGASVDLTNANWEVEFFPYL